MAVVVVAGSEPGAGATTIAVGLAHRFAYAGHEVRLERIGGDGHAEHDAATFAGLEFASGLGSPVTPDALRGGAGVTIVEAPAAANIDPAALAATLDARLVLVTSHHVGAPATAAEVIVHSERAGAHPPASGQPPAYATMIGNRASRAGHLQLAEDRLLAAPTVGELIAASRARVLSRSAEGERALCQHIVIGAISHDSDEPYFRRFPAKAVVTRAEKVDIALSALRTETACLILTGGADPSPYLLDRVAALGTTTLLLAPEGTVETVRDIEGTFGRAPFGGDAKVERIGTLMADAVDDETVEALVGQPR